MRTKTVLINYILKHKKTLFLASIIVLAIAILYVSIFVYNRTPDVTTEQINTRLSASSELTTAKLNGTGFSVYKDTGLPIINRADFLMIYEYTVRAGIDIKDVKTEVDNNNRIVYLTIPTAKILDVSVDPSSIKYYDEHFALFNVDEREDANKAQTEATSHAKEEALKTGILTMANTQSETLIKGLLIDIIPNNYEIRITKKSN